MKQTIKFLSLALALAFTLGTSRSSAQTAEYKAVVEEVIQLSNGKDAAVAAMTQMYDGMGLKFSIPTRQVCEKIVDAIWPETVEATAKAYAQYFTLSDMKAMAAFYKTPLGAKMALHLAEVTADTQKFSDSAAMEKKVAPIIQKYLKR